MKSKKLKLNLAAAYDCGCRFDEAADGCLLSTVGIRGKGVSSAKVDKYVEIPVYDSGSGNMCSRRYRSDVRFREVDGKVYIQAKSYGNPDLATFSQHKEIKRLGTKLNGVRISVRKRCAIVNLHVDLDLNKFAFLDRLRELLDDAATYCEGQVKVVDGKKTTEMSVYDYMLSERSKLV